MPELPEAETIACQLRARLLGATITECRIERADIVREGLTTLPWYRGAHLVSASRLGKSVVLEADRSGKTRYLVFELGMTGLLFFTLLDPSYRKHTHLTAVLLEPQTVRSGLPARRAWPGAVCYATVRVRSVDGALGRLPGGGGAPARAPQGPAHATTSNRRYRQHLCE